MGQVGNRAWVDDDGSVAAGLVWIGDGSVRKKEGSVEEERGDREAVRRETQRKENESKKE